MKSIAGERRERATVTSPGIAFGNDGRRLRPNLMIGGVEGLGERKWPGRKLRTGDVIIDIDSLRGRCVTL